jgi:hypothetical protein
MLLANYHAPNRTITTAQLAKAGSYRNYTGAAFQCAKFGDHLCDFLEYKPTTTRGKAEFVWATVLVDSPPTRSIGEYEWTLRPEIVQALEELGWVERAISDDTFGTADDYFRAFQALQNKGKGISENHIALLNAHFNAPNHTATWAQLAKAVGYPSGDTVNLQYGTFAGRVAQQLGIREKPKGFWLYVLAEWGDKGELGHQAFVLRRPVIEALTRLGILPKIERKKAGKAAHAPVKATKTTAAKKSTKKPTVKVAKNPAKKKVGNRSKSSLAFSVDQVPDGFFAVRHGRKYRDGSKWVLTTKKGVNIKTFDDEAALDQWWKDFQQSQKRNPLPLIIGTAKNDRAKRKKGRKAHSKCYAGTPMGKAPSDPKRPWSEKYDMPEYDFE